EEALRRNLNVAQPKKARDPHFVELLKSLRPDLIIVAAYGQILPQSILDLPRYGCLNVHASLLPKWRGAAPIQWSILTGEKETGITIMKMDAGLDTGDILTMRAVPIEETDTAEVLHDKLAKVGADLLMVTIPEYASGKITSQKQSENDATYAPKISRQ